VISPLQKAHADSLEDNIVIALGIADTQVSESEAASSSVAPLVSTAITEAQQAQQASIAVGSQVSAANSAVTAVNNAVTVVTNATGVDQSSSLIIDAKGTVTSAQTAIDAISTVIAQSELAQAVTARTAVTSAVNNAATQFSEANASISNAQDAINALQATIATVRTVLEGVDDAGIQMVLPFSMQMGGVTYNSIYVGSNATITFGANEGHVYWDTPSAPSVSVGGMDWTTWSYGSGITYSTTQNSLDIAWDLRAFPTTDSSVQLTQLRFNADVNPTTGAWIANVSGVGPWVDATRWNYRPTNNGTIIAIVDQDTVGTNEFQGSLSQGNYTVPATTTDNSAIQATVDAANAQLAGLNQRITGIVVINSNNQQLINTIPSVASIQNGINAANTTKANLQTLLTTKATNLVNAINNNIPTPPPVIEDIIYANGKATVQVSMPTGFTSNTWFYQVSTTDESAINPYAGQTLNTDGSPDSFDISGLSEGATYTISIANWSGPLSSYVSYDLIIPDAPSTGGSLKGSGWIPEIPVEQTPEEPTTPEEEAPEEPEPPIEEPQPEEPSEEPESPEEETPQPQEPEQPVDQGPTDSEDNNSQDNSTPGMEENNPDSLPETDPKLPDPEDLQPRIQKDIAGVENGGIEFFGTKTQPQVVGEDGKLTPPPPPPGSGLPIPEGAITITDTFIGQPGGTTFNSPDVAVPVIMSWVCTTITKEDGTEVHIDLDNNEHPIERCTFLPDAINAIPGAAEAVQAIGAVYTDLANIGNDMSPITRQKAKKILVATLIVVPIARRRFGQ
jgi:hypothetical protein